MKINIMNVVSYLVWLFIVITILSSKGRFSNFEGIMLVLVSVVFFMIAWKLPLITQDRTKTQQGRKT